MTLNQEKYNILIGFVKQKKSIYKQYKLTQKKLWQTIMQLISLLCNNYVTFDLVKIESIYIHLNKPKSSRQKEFDYSLSLFR